MNDTFSLLTVVALFILQVIISEVDKRRMIAREESLMKMVKSLQNRISAKDLGSYLALEEQEKPQAIRSVPQPTPEDMFEGLPFGMNGGM